MLTVSIERFSEVKGVTRRNWHVILEISNLQNTGHID